MTKEELYQIVESVVPQRQCNEEFHHYVACFTDCMGRPYHVPAELIKTAICICRSYGIKGICDPMYIANTIAKDLGIGDGMHNFRVSSQYKPTFGE